MLSLVAMAVLSQAQIDTQICNLVGKQLDVHVVMGNAAGKALYNIHCSNGECTGAYLKLDKDTSEARKISFLDLGSMGSFRMQPTKGSMVVLEHGVNQITVDLKEGRVVRTSGTERAEGWCKPSFYP